MNAEWIKLWVKNYGKYLLGVTVITILLYWGYHEYQEWKQYLMRQSQVKAADPVVLPPQVIHTTTETIREVSVQPPSREGAILQFIERQGKVIAIVNGQEVEVPNASGQPDVKIGENGELRFSTSSVAKIDVTDMANAQARLIANQELEKQAKWFQEEMKKEKNSRKKERTLWIIGSAAGGYLLSR